MLRLWTPRCWRPMLEKSWSGMRGQCSSSSGAKRPSSLARGTSSPAAGMEIDQSSKMHDSGSEPLGRTRYTERVGELGEHEVVGEGEEDASPSGQCRRIGWGHRDARTRRIGVDLPHQFGTEGAAVGDRPAGHPLDHVEVPGAGHGLEPAAQQPCRLDDGGDLAHTDPRPLVGLGPGAELEAGVTPIVDGVLQAVRVVLLGVAEGELWVGAGHVVPLHEGLLRHLPVGREDRLLPPDDPHVAEAERVEQAGDGVQCLRQRGCRGVEVDPGAGAPDLDPDLHEAELVGCQLFGGEGMGTEDEGVLALQVPLPSVERAGDPVPPERPAAGGQLGGPVAAGVQIAPDGPVVHPDQQDRLVGDRVLDVVPRGGELLEPAGHLPDPGPEAASFELGELGVEVAGRGHEVVPGHGVGHRPPGGGPVPPAPGRRPHTDLSHGVPARRRPAVDRRAW